MCEGGGGALRQKIRQKGQAFQHTTSNEASSGVGGEKSTMQVVLRGCTILSGCERGIGALSPNFSRQPTPWTQEPPLLVAQGKSKRHVRQIPKRRPLRPKHQDALAEHNCDELPFPLYASNVIFFSEAKFHSLLERICIERRLGHFGRIWVTALVL